MLDAPTRTSTSSGPGSGIGRDVRTGNCPATSITMASYDVGSAVTVERLHRHS